MSRVSKPGTACGLMGAIGPSRRIYLKLAPGASFRNLGWLSSSSLSEVSEADVLPKMSKIDDLSESEHTSRAGGSSNFSSSSLIDSVSTVFESLAGAKLLINFRVCMFSSFGVEDFSSGKSLSIPMRSQVEDLAGMLLRRGGLGFPRRSAAAEETS